MQPEDLTDRQRRELAYHRGHAEKSRVRIEHDAAMDVVENPSRRPWNAYWSMYDRIRALGMAGKRVLIPGCGFGEDSIRISRMGAQVSAFDLSAEVVDIAVQRAARFGDDIDFGVMTAEAMRYPDDSFDLIVFVDILHHVDIAATMYEARRVLKPGGMIIGDELYTHSMLQRVRESAPVARGLYPLMRRWIYRDETPYITADEHKVDQHEFAIVRAGLIDGEADYFGVLEGRLFPVQMAWASKIDRRFMRFAGPLAPLLGSRVVFSGRVRKG